MAKYSMTVNGKRSQVDADEDTPLLYVLQNELGLKGPRFGCGMAQCGSCSVLLDGAEIRSCVVPAAVAHGKQVTTLEGLAGHYARTKGLSKIPAAHPIQQAFVDMQSMQCGYCYNGMAVKGAELLTKNPNPSTEQIREHMQGHLCRCGTYPRVVKAIQRAATIMRETE